MSIPAKSKRFQNLPCKPFEPYLLDAVDNLADLAELSQEELEHILGDARQAKTLHDFLHAPFPVHGSG